MGLFTKKTNPKAPKKKRKKVSTVPKTMKWCEGQGLVAYKAESPRMCVGKGKDDKPVFITRDLCGVADVIAFDALHGCVIFIQCTDHNNFAAHVTKYEKDLDCSTAIATMIQCGQRFEIHSWESGGDGFKRLVYSIDVESQELKTVLHQMICGA